MGVNSNQLKLYNGGMILSVGWHRDAGSPVGISVLFYSDVTYDLLCMPICR